MNGSTSIDEEVKKAQDTLKKVWNDWNTNFPTECDHLNYNLDRLLGKYHEPEKVNLAVQGRVFIRCDEDMNVLQSSVAKDEHYNNKDALFVNLQQYVLLKKQFG